MYEKGSFTATPGGYRILASEVENSADAEAAGYVAFDLFIKNLSGEEYYPTNLVANEEGQVMSVGAENLQSGKTTLYNSENGIIVATGYMWALVPEVVSFGEYTSGRRIAGIVNALTGIFFKAGMALGGVVPGLVLAIVGFDAALPQQTALAEQGILWLVCVIPAVLLFLAMFIISKYELEDDVIDKINLEIEARAKNA